MYNDQERKVFPYFDGVDYRYADPLRLRRRFWNKLEGNPKKFLEQAKSEDHRFKEEAVEKLLAATLYAFELPPFDPYTGQGTTEDVLLSLLNQFFDYLESVKKNTETLLTTAGSMDSPHDPSTMKPMSACG